MQENFGLIFSLPILPQAKIPEEGNRLSEFIDICVHTIDFHSGNCMFFVCVCTKEKLEGNQYSIAKQTLPCLNLLRIN